MIYIFFCSYTAAFILATQNLYVEKKIAIDTANISKWHQGSTSGEFLSCCFEISFLELLELFYVVSLDHTIVNLHAIRFRGLTFHILHLYLFPLYLFSFFIQAMDLTLPGITTRSGSLDLSLANPPSAEVGPTDCGRCQPLLEYDPFRIGPLVCRSPPRTMENKL